MQANRKGTGNRPADPEEQEVGEAGLFAAIGQSVFLFIHIQWQRVYPQENRKKQGGPFSGPLNPANSAGTPGCAQIEVTRTRVPFRVFHLRAARRVFVIAGITAVGAAAAIFTGTEGTVTQASVPAFRSAHEILCPTGIYTGGLGKIIVLGGLRDNRTRKIVGNNDHTSDGGTGKRQADHEQNKPGQR